MKKSLWQKVKDKWNEINPYDREWIKAVAIWTVDGALFGTMITAAVKDVKRTKDMTIAYQMGVIDGQMNAYKEMAQKPYQMMDAGMKLLDKQGKATHF